MSRWISTVCVFALAACVMLAVLWLRAESRLRQLQQEVRYTLDAPSERRAYLLKARSERSNVSKIEALLFPITVSFPDRHCVELRPRWGVTGGTSITCFSNETGKILSHNNIGE
ncbi:hypothetical protein [Blastomonas fulva]|jgi:hypothetical protein|uniref:hypothetical protein n=1 Tax=Blastomonas fulva TaxID=1550728 RepID=UPI0013C2CB49|nr:hypothetical protein [Blastomonas fulva]